MDDFMPEFLYHIEMSWIDLLLLPFTLLAWLFLSWDAVDRLCRKKGWKMRDDIGMIIWVIVGLSCGIYIMDLFNLI